VLNLVNASQSYVATITWLYINDANLAKELSTMTLVDEEKLIEDESKNEYERAARYLRSFVSETGFDIPSKIADIESVLSEFNKLLKKDISLLEKSSIYVSLLKIYKTSLEINRKACVEYPEILRILPTVETLDADIEMLEKDDTSLAQKIEKLINDGFLPQPFRVFAERVEELCRVELEKYVA
jgi:hypothetical protein